MKFGRLIDGGIRICDDCGTVTLEDESHLCQSQEVKMASTEYVIFSTADGATWKILGTIEASGQASAIREYATTNSIDSGMLAALPVRSWQPVKVEPKVVSALKFSPVTTYGVTRAPAPIE